MTGTLSLKNRQCVHPIDTRFLRRIVQGIVAQQKSDVRFELGLHLIGDAEMTVLNERYLRHAGSTDVITFDYGSPTDPQFLAGEIFICLDEATRQARRFRTSWQTEVVRYVIHGLLHMQGHDDSEATARRKMKCEEDRLLRKVRNQFDVNSIGKASKPRLKAGLKQ